MRCKACNVDLTGTELLKKDPITEDYVDLCNKCIRESTTEDKLLLAVHGSIKHEDNIFLRQLKQDGSIKVQWQHK